MKKSEVTFKYNWTDGCGVDDQMYNFMDHNTDTPEKMEEWLSLIENLGRRVKHKNTSNDNIEIIHVRRH